MKTVYYKQCVLRRQLSPQSSEETVSWIPEQYAIAGECIQLKNKKGVWTNGWRVMSANHKLAEDQLPDHHKEKH